MTTGNKDIRELTADEITAVTGAAKDLITVIGCTTPWPPGGYPPGTILWNPWLSPRPIVV